jgi:hypothetical protein
VLAYALREIAECLAISFMMKHLKVHVDTSAYKASRFPAELVAYMRGPGK